MIDTRAFLIKKGMKEEFADDLAKQYITRLEGRNNVKIVRIMDLFDTSSNTNNAEALTLLMKVPLKNVSLNY